MPEFAITLARWAAWAPGLESAEQWARWSGDAAPATGNPPALEWLPAMQRRRLAPLARGVFQVARQAAGDLAGSVPTVLASTHGELSRTIGLLEDIADGEPLSPAAFSLSVHNAVSGQLSIALGNRAPASSVALAGDGLGAALLEAHCLASPPQPVLVVLYEAPLPHQYHRYYKSDPFPWALALLLGERGQRYTLTSAPGSRPQLAQGPRLARFLARGEADLTLAGERSDWHWSHHARPE
ncbi:3-oxoacyl-ACP synthase (plasmid) [Alcanivorax sp. N3-2A]|nr:3-oxoacyl-ACP synthase [Alcanivorax sp. N3-2A]ASK36786.1 3-oxoacyl-ACP synthase [Alcanivorax sp. N3-2A]|tara:strand:- start:36970 stop:37689 length:720 start_codon:yes stop_codon:yes gene_type:complete